MAQQVWHSAGAWHDCRLVWHEEGAAQGHSTSDTARTAAGGKPGGCGLQGGSQRGQWAGDGGAGGAASRRNPLAVVGVGEHRETGRKQRWRIRGGGTEALARRGAAGGDSTAVLGAGVGQCRRMGFLPVRRKRWLHGDGTARDGSSRRSAAGVLPEGKKSAGPRRIRGDGVSRAVEGVRRRKWGRPSTDWAWAEWWSVGLEEMGKRWAVGWWCWAVDVRREELAGGGGGRASDLGGDGERRNGRPVGLLVDRRRRRWRGGSGEAVLGSGQQVERRRRWSGMGWGGEIWCLTGDEGEEREEGFVRWGGGLGLGFYGAWGGWSSERTVEAPVWENGAWTVGSSSFRR